MSTTSNIEILKVQITDSISKVISVIQQSGPFACALLYENGRFINIFTDGDVRRAILSGCRIEETAQVLNSVKSKTSRPKPIMANVDSSQEFIDGLFQKYALRQLILVNDQDEPVKVVDHLSHGHDIETINQKFVAIVMAGGFGTRLHPLTLDTPKPMLPINGQPLLEILVEKLIIQGAESIQITTHYLPEKIISHFGDGSQYGVPIQYIHEETPLGTGGSLALIEKPTSNVLVINGDILTELDFKMFHAEHIRNEAFITVGTKQYSYQVPYGVLKEENGQILGIEEKPNYSFLVNSGIYFISPKAFEFLPNQKGAFTMPDFVENLISVNKKVSCFPIFESWLDIGRHDDYLAAMNIYKKHF
jgi:dTDP-glucose pyrophosphorylase